MNPGIYQISFSEYSAIRAISNTALGKLAIAPSVYKHWRENPSEVSTPAQKIGRIAHRAILEPKEFEAEFNSSYAVRPDGLDFRTKAGKEWKAVAEASGLEVITFEQGEFLSGAIKAIAAHPIASQMLASGKAEQSIVADYNGLPIKARLDFLTDGDSIVDLKTTASAEPNEFDRDIYNHCYYRQASFYLDAAVSIGLPVKHFCILAIEKVEPYLISCHQISPEWLEIGRNEYMRLLSTYVECKRSDKWPGYPERLYTSTPPEWLVKKMAA
jgi:hypothetical protein